MSARSKARKQALDLLYETDIRGTNLVETLEARDISAEGPDAQPIREYTRELVKGVSENRRKIDELIRVPLSKRILFDQLTDCTLNVVLNGDQIEFETAVKTETSVPLPV